MKTITTFPNRIHEIKHIEIPMPDGCRLAARIWMPENASNTPVPAILEYLPYRKNDLTHSRDAPMQSYLAGHGYAVVRLDLRGAGDSRGLMEGEYLQQEMQDGYDAIAWIAEQDWCDGGVGMVGNSWGGFNSLQIAAMQPPALKAIVTVCSTDDRYADDVHYMGGCMLGEQLSWSTIMFARNTLPPDPQNVGPNWRQLWQQRLQGSGLWLKNWLQHQTRDAFWQHGSVCEDWDAIKVPVYAASGWADGYCRSVFRLMENLNVPCKGLVGPWGHGYPHMGLPGPGIGFLQDELRWWDHWLKGRQTGIMDEPRLRLFMQESEMPSGGYTERAGRWVAEPSWPSPNISRTELTLGMDGTLGAVSKNGVLTHTSPLDVGMASGKWCNYGLPGESPLDQRRDDAGSLCFETAALLEPMEMAGDAVLTLRLSVDRPVAQLAARLVEVFPNGQATRVSFGVLNLTHRNSHETPEELVPGEVYTVQIPFKHVAQQFAVGNRIRLAISTSYFPMIWPAPEPVTLSLHTEGSALELPLRKSSPADLGLPNFLPAEAGPEMETEILQEGDNYWRIIEDAQTGVMEIKVAEGDGVYKIVNNDLTIHSQGYETYRIDPTDITSATGKTRWEYSFSRGDWAMSSSTGTTLTADASDFIIKAQMKVWEGETLCHEETWDERIPRNLV